MAHYKEMTRECICEMWYNHLEIDIEKMMSSAIESIRVSLLFTSMRNTEQHHNNFFHHILVVLLSSQTPVNNLHLVLDFSI